jgi:hypothetical protein
MSKRLRTGVPPLANDGGGQRRRTMRNDPARFDTCYVDSRVEQVKSIAFGPQEGHRGSIDLQALGHEPKGALGNLGKGQMGDLPIEFRDQPNDVELTRELL